MKFYSLLIILQCVISLGLKSQTSIIELSNSEVSSILKSYDPSLDIDTACVTCRYIAQKIYKVFEIDSKCTDIVSTKLINHRESLLKKEPDIVSKWTNVYNVQKDYYTRIIPKIKEIKNYDETLRINNIKEKEREENMKNLIEFENKINRDLREEERVKIIPVKETVVSKPIPADEVKILPIPLIQQQFQFKQKRNRTIDNPPTLNFSSFIESDDTTVDIDFYKAIDTSMNYNIETMRRGRRSHKYPDPQWDCAELQIGKILKYLCEEEVSHSYQKYCTVLFKQINTITESLLYHDNNIALCQNVHMCPLSSEIN